MGGYHQVSTLGRDTGKEFAAQAQSQRTPHTPQGLTADPLDAWARPQGQLALSSPHPVHVLPTEDLASDRGPLPGKHCLLSSLHPARPLVGTPVIRPPCWASCGNTPGEVLLTRTVIRPLHQTESLCSPPAPAQAQFPPKGHGGRLRESGGGN